MSRGERLQFSKENEMRRQYDDGNSHEEKDSSDDHESNRPTIVKRKKTAPPPNGPQPRWKSPNRDGSESTDEEISHDDGNVGCIPVDKPVKKRGVSIEDMIDEEPMLTVNLDEDSEDEEEKVDFKVPYSSL